MHMNGDVLHHIGRLDLKLLKQPEFKQATTVEKSRLRDVALRKFSAHALCSRSSTNAAVYTGAASSDACKQKRNCERVDDSTNTVPSPRSDACSVPNHRLSFAGEFKLSPELSNRIDSSIEQGTRIQTPPA